MARRMKAPRMADIDGRKLRARRLAKGLTQEQMAFALRANGKYAASVDIALWEQTSECPMDRLTDICDVLGCRLPDICFGSRRKEASPP